MVAASILRRHGTVAPSGRGVTLPAFHQAARGGRSIFPSRVFDPDEIQRVLKSGHQSRKIGAFATKGPRKGWPIYTLTLEERELNDLAAAHPRGFIIRLHVLGDFYSADYVEFWRGMLGKFDALHVFGFTAHAPDSVIGRALGLMAADFGWSRCAVRFSGAPHEKRAARVIEQGEVEADAILCPAQTGKTDCCATCGLCWQSERSIAFRRH